MCIHHWSIRINGNNGHSEWICSECPAQVDFTEARAGWEWREAQSPQEQRWPLVPAKAG